MHVICNMHMACKNQDITCIHAPINLPIMWFMSSACHMQRLVMYFMCITCAYLYMHIADAHFFDFVPILNEMWEGLVTHFAHTYI